ncbi:hypothetical protein ABZX12_35105 [Kribbella sp. NPDC003505]|uniref:hypothetical protein n=1 Tax=Kribbella sp. NPDC003505 TaxID=3154448 RepID=UPI0033B3AC94
MDETLYRKSMGNQWVYGGLAVAALALIGIGGLIAQPVLLVAGVVLLPVAIYFFAQARYGNVRVTRQELVVGKHTLVLRDLDRSFGAHPAEAVLSKDQLDRLNTQTASDVVGETGVRIVGGAWGRLGRGVQWIVVRRTDSPELLAVPARQPKDLLAAVNTALA